MADSSTNTITPHDLHGRDFRHPQRTDYLANKTGLVARLDKILAAASNDGQTTVSMSPEDRAALAHQLAEALQAHDAAKPADAVEA